MSLVGVRDIIGTTRENSSIYGVYQKNLFEHLKQKIKCKEYEKIETAGIFTCGFL